MKISCLIITLLCVVSCSTTPYFVNLGNDDIGMARVSKLYGKGEYFYFYSYYLIQEDDINNGYKVYFDLVENEVLKQGICNDEYEIIKQSLSYYSENGNVSILIKCT